MTNIIEKIDSTKTVCKCIKYADSDVIIDFVETYCGVAAFLDFSDTPRIDVQKFVRDISKGIKRRHIIGTDNDKFVSVYFPEDCVEDINFLANLLTEYLPENDGYTAEDLHYFKAM